MRKFEAVMMEFCSHSLPNNLTWPVNATVQLKEKPVHGKLTIDKSETLKGKIILNVVRCQTASAEDPSLITTDLSKKLLDYGDFEIGPEEGQIYMEVCKRYGSYDIWKLRGNERLIVFQKQNSDITAGLMLFKFTVLEEVPKEVVLPDGGEEWKTKEGDEYH